jgi:hypothetical protein
MFHKPANPMPRMPWSCRCAACVVPGAAAAHAADRRKRPTSPTCRSRSWPISRSPRCRRSPSGCRMPPPRCSSSPPTTSAAPAPSAFPKRCAWRPTCTWRRARYSQCDQRARPERQQQQRPNKLLVLIDGRSVYAPLFPACSGTCRTDAGRRRAHRSHQRPGRHAVGRERRQRRHQHHHPLRADTTGSLAHAARPAPRRAMPASARAARRDSAAGACMARHQVVRHTRDWAAARRRTTRATRAQPGFGATGAGRRRFQRAGQCLPGSLEQPEPGEMPSRAPICSWARSAPGRQPDRALDNALDGGGSLSGAGLLDHTQREVPPTFTESLDMADLQFQHSLAAAARTAGLGGQLPPHLGRA